MVGKRRRLGELARLLQACATACVVVPALMTLGVGRVSAQSGGVQWSEPINLSESPEGSVDPAIVADRYGIVHVFWSEDIGGPELGLHEQLATLGNTIMYRRWDGTSWSPKVDILAVRGDPFADFVSVDIDNDGIIHATWTGFGAIYYSCASAREADNVRAWATPTIIGDGARSMRESSVVVDASGNVHVIYAASGGAGVQYVVLRKGGTTWSLPVTISAALGSLEGGCANVRLIVDSAGRLHATWQTFQAQGFGQGVYYARSVDDGASWSMPVLFRYRQEGDTWVEWPYMAAGSGADLFLIYVDGTNMGRAFRTSRDGGETWSEAETVLEELEGINGYVMPLVDGSGQVHLIATMRTHTQIGGIFHSQWTRNGFAPATLVIPDDHSPRSGSIHYTDATVRLGNELHLVWNEISGSEIWYARGLIEGVEASHVSAFLLQPTTAALAGTTTVVPASGGLASKPDDVVGESLSSPETAADPAKGIWTSILVPVTSVLVLLAGVLIWRTHRR